MSQIILTISVLLFLVVIMSVGMIFKGIPMRKSCGGILGGDKSECGVCSGGEEPENCPDE
jgi:hypothetical protein